MSVRGHHFQGAVGGLLLGLALTIMLTLYGVLRLGEMGGVWMMLVCLAFGITWSFVAPAPKQRPAPDAAAEQPAPE